MAIGLGPYNQVERERQMLNGHFVKLFFWEKGKNRPSHESDGLFYGTITNTGN
jgi:hypothetical protein